MAQERDKVAARFGAAVRQARQRRGWSPVVLADAIGVSEEFVRKIEHGLSDPPLSVAARIAVVLDLVLVLPRIMTTAKVAGALRKRELRAA